MATRKRKLLKIIIIGDMAVGKTSLLDKFVDGDDAQFKETYKGTIGADFLVKDVEIDAVHVTLQIWDTAGQERFNSLGKAFYRGADAFIIVYDCNNITTFKKVSELRKDAIEQAGFDENNADDMVPFGLLCNKYDLLSDDFRIGSTKSNYGHNSKLKIKLLCHGYCRKMETMLSNVDKLPIDIIEVCRVYVGHDLNVESEGRMYAEINNMIYHCVSAKDGYNVDHAFIDIADKAFAKMMRNNDSKGIQWDGDRDLWYNMSGDRGNWNENANANQKDKCNNCLVL